MLEGLLLYFGDTQREGRLVTRRMRSTLILWTLAGVFFFIAFVAAIIAGSIYLAKELGAGPAALVIAGVAFLLGAIMLVTLAIMRRPRRYVTRPASPVSAISLAAAPLAVQSLLSGALRARPFLTLGVAMLAGFVATRTSVRKK
jgi:hypothetical protein